MASKDTKRARDFFRLDRRDRADLKLLLSRDIIIPDALTMKREFTSKEAFFRLRDKYITRLREAA